MPLATNLNKSFYIVHTTGATIYCKIQRIETNTYYDFVLGQFVTTPSGSNGKQNLTESGKISTLYFLNWNSGDNFTDGEYLVAFYNASGDTLLSVQKFLVRLDRINIIEGFSAVPAG